MSEGDGTSDRPSIDPYTLQAVGEDHAFWADAMADLVEERIAERAEETNPSDDTVGEEPIVLKGGISPSGIPHLGNANEIVLNYFVAEALRDRGHEVRQVFTLDDRDPLRGLPRTLADLDGEIVGLGDVNAGALGQNLGKPYTAIPDPFGCCDSYGDHFSQLIEGIAEQLDVPMDVVSNTELYENGSFEARTAALLADRERAREVLAHYQDKVDEDYVPFNPICADCGKITETVTDVNLVRTDDGDRTRTDDGDVVADADGDLDPANSTVDYRCTDLEAGDDVIEGCGHEGTATLREGKLPWRFEWVAQWEEFGVDFEPFGKDHAEGSWPSGVDVAQSVFEIEPPTPMVYEWFTLEDEPFSSSSGHVVLVSEVLELIEPEVLRYFFAKDPARARDFSIERLDQLVGEFDRLEATYFEARGDAGGVDDGGGSGDPSAVDDAGHSEAIDSGSEIDDGQAIDTGADIDDGAAIDDGQAIDAGADTTALEDAAAKERAFATRVYPFLVENEREQRLRIPYSFGAVLGMTDDPDLREEIARREGHLPADAPDWAIEEALARVERAREWARRTDNEYNYELKRAAMPDVDLDPATEAALDDLADLYETTDDPEAIQGEVYEAAKRHDVDVGDFFATGYRLFFDQEQGPKLGHFLAKLDEEFVLRRLRREG